MRSETCPDRHHQRETQFHVKRLTRRVAFYLKRYPCECVALDSVQVFFLNSSDSGESE